MSPPHVENRISLGNIIQITILLVTVSIAWGRVENRLSAHDDSIARLEGAAEDQILRTRAMETNSARQEERLSSIYSLLSKIDSRLERIEQSR